MPFQENLREFLDVDGGFASDATIAFADGRRTVVQGILSVEYVDIEAGLAGFAGSNPCFECAASDVEGLEYNDRLHIADKDYLIKGIKPDGTGWMVLIVEEQ